MYLLLISETYFGDVNELVLEVQLRGSPKPAITWMKNGMTIIEPDQTTYGRFRAEYHASVGDIGGKCRLIIQRPRESDSGVYTCVGRNVDATLPGRKVSNMDEVTKLLHVKFNSPPGKETPTLKCVHPDC
jgi:hypothetical protein